MLQSDAKTREPLATLDFVGAPKKQKNKQSNQISKNLIKPMISAKAVSYTEGYRSGHNEAVLKTVWAPAHKGSNPFPSAIKSLVSTRLFHFSNEFRKEIQHENIVNR